MTEPKKTKSAPVAILARVSTDKQNNEIVKGKRSVTADTALRLERYFGWPGEVWLNLQSHHDKQSFQEAMKSTLSGIRPCAAM